MKYFLSNPTQIHQCPQRIKEILTMTTEFELYLDKYAEVVVKIGLNLQPGQRLLIGSPMFDSLTPVEAAPLVRLVSKHAYKAGASLVDVLWGDDQLKPIRLQQAPRDSFEEYPDWQVRTTLEYMLRGDAFLGIYSHDPDLLQNQDQNLVGLVEQISAAKTSHILDLIGRNTTNWLMIAAVVPGWAAKVFPDTPVETQDTHLWDAIFDICRMKHTDPVAAWRDHIDELAKRCAYLNQKQYTALRYSGPGTDLTLGLPLGHTWKSAAMTSSSGIPFTANIPTEEVFTLPHCAKVDGVVAATKPLSFAGGVIENYSLTFKEGRVVKYSADRGEQNLRSLLETDQGASRLGEVSLVPHSSPISQSGLTFYNILIDENAASHLAFGHAYKFNLENGEGLSDQAFAEAGGNLSSIHIDFMVGSGEVNVDGITKDGSAQPIMRRGEWSFEV
jgi:aminopeptidase